MEGIMDKRIRKIYSKVNIIFGKLIILIIHLNGKFTCGEK